MDARLFRALHEALSGGPTLLVMAALTVIGSGWTMLAFVPFLLPARTRAVTRSLVATLTVTAILVFVVKHVVRRARPCACLDGVRALVFAAPEDYSFPSGHSAGSFAFAAFLCVLLLARDRGPARLGIVLGLVALAVGVSLSRVALGVHFPSDVAAGGGLGVACGALGAWLHVRESGARAAKLGGAGG